MSQYRILRKATAKDPTNDDERRFRETMFMIVHSMGTTRQAISYVAHLAELYFKETHSLRLTSKRIQNEIPIRHMHQMVHMDIYGR